MTLNSLNRQETKTHIAFGLNYVDSRQWLISVPEMGNLLYAVEIDNTSIRALLKGGTASLSLCGYHGLAFDGNYSSKHDWVFIVSFSNYFILNLLIQNLNGKIKARQIRCA
ncbi:MAG: hypothetical protein JXQ23_11570 [Clostridia bacterium]|nr:hypothetical protein [Clostridia bacterium]